MPPQKDLGDDVEHGDKDDGPIMKQPKFKDDLKVCSPLFPFFCVLIPI